MKLLALVLALFQFGPRAPLTPAETLLEPEILRALRDQTAGSDGGNADIAGANVEAGDILLTCQLSCGAANQAMRKIDALVAAKTIPRPARTIVLTSGFGPARAQRTKAIIHVAQGAEFRPLSIAAVTDYFERLAKAGAVSLK